MCINHIFEKLGDTHSNRFLKEIGNSPIKKRGTFI